MAYAIYLRKSRADEEAERRGEGETLARHRKVLTQLAARNGHAVGRTYEEIVSGETISARPQMQQLLADVIAGAWDGVYVMEVERLARGDAMDQGRVSMAFQFSGTLIYTPIKTYNPADLFDQEYLEFALFMSRREFKTINRRMRAGVEQSVREGHFLASRAAYGYRITQTPTGPSLVIHEEEAAVVRQIYDWYLNGIDGTPAGYTRIATRLNRLHIPNASALARDWRPVVIARILCNPVYIGLIEWGRNKTERIATPNGVVKKRVLQQHGQCYPGLHQPIISREVYDAVQARRKSHAGPLPVRDGLKLSNPLAGLVYCAECGHAMGGLPECGRQKAKLKCRTTDCPTVQSNLVPVEHAILQTLRAWLDDAQREIATGEQLPPREDGADIVASAIAAMRAERDKIVRQLDRAKDLLEQDVYSIPEYNDRAAKLQSRISAVDADIAEAERELAEKPQYKTPRELAPALIHLFEHYAGADATERNAMLRACVSRIVYRRRRREGDNVPYADRYTDFELDIFPTLRQ